MSQPIFTPRPIFTDKPIFTQALMVWLAFFKSLKTSSTHMQNSETIKRNFINCTFAYRDRKND